MRSWDVPLDRLKKLTISHVDADYIPKVLRCCSALEELEIWTGERDEGCVGSVKAGLSNEDFLPIRDSVRRLCYSHTDAIFGTYDWKSWPSSTADLTVEESFGIGWGDLGHLTSKLPILSFIGFPRLEILEVDQSLLYDRNNRYQERDRTARFSQEKASGPETFMSKLPQSLRILHVGMVAAWPEMCRDLLGLAEAAPSRFPSLKVVRLDCYTLPLAEESENLTVALLAANIDLVLAPAPMSNFSRGMLRGRPGYCIEVQEPSFLYSLED